MSREPYWFRSDPDRPFENGDHVITHPHSFVGTLTDFDGRSGRIVLDQPHDHFTDAIHSSADELQLYRDSEIEDAQTLDQELTNAIKDGLDLLRETTVRLGELHEERAVARRDLREAKQLPIKKEQVVPTYTDGTDNGKPIPYLAEEDLLAVANAVRKAGGADVIDAFFPSVPSDETSCLIANALNFKSEVGAVDEDPDHENEFLWYMQFPRNMQKYKIKAIAEAIEALGYDDVSWNWEDRKLYLPRLVGNTAAAFDSARRGWVVKYRIKED